MLVLYSQFRNTLSHPYLSSRHERHIELYKQNISYQDSTYLTSLDPTNWKEQDHYKVLGIENLRYLASEEDIKKAYKKRALSHHPDKTKSSNEYFPAIIKAFEILSDSERRRSFDSVDPTFDDTLPDFQPLDVENDKIKFNHFFDSLDKYFKLNSRWSMYHPVPMLGSFEASQDSINDFYHFWYNFKSWREFSYLDKEDKSRGENRDERRWIDKQNKSERQRLRKEEINRIRKLVDMAYNNDIRVQRIKEREREKKLAIKLARQKEKQIQNEATIATTKPKQSSSETNQELREAQIRAIAEQTRSLNVERKQLSRLLITELSSLPVPVQNLIKRLGFADNPTEYLVQMNNLINWLGLEDLKQLNVQTSATFRDDHALNDNANPIESSMIGLASIIKQHLTKMNEHLEHEKTRHLIPVASNKGSIVTNSSNTKSSTVAPAFHWSENQVRDLVKATEIYPVGTQERWEVIANYLAKRHPDVQIAANNVIQKIKELKITQTHDKQQATVPKPIAASDSNTSSNIATVNVWTKEEQSRLENGLKIVALKDTLRWDKIAQLVETKSKAECIKRYKEIVEYLKSQKK